MSTSTVNFWDSAPDRFLEDDRANEARCVAAAAIAGEAGKRGKVDLLEVGFGPGFDLLDHLWPLLKSGRISSYVGFDGSVGMVERLRLAVQAKAVEAPLPKTRKVDLRHGTFADLEPDVADVAYTKALFEHQPEFAGPLRSFIRAARKLAIINWYRPPATAELRDYDAAIGVHSITWRRADVERVLVELGCTWTTRLMPERPCNELWFVRRADHGRRG